MEFIMPSDEDAGNEPGRHGNAILRATLLEQPEVGADPDADPDTDTDTDADADLAAPATIS